MVTNTNMFIFGLFLIIAGGLITVRDQIGYPIFVLCLVISSWSALILSELKKMNDD